MDEIASTAAKIRRASPKGELKREEILERAIEAFGKIGYHATSMREIASACDLSQAGLLHHFPNKEALLLAIVQYRESVQNTFAPNDMQVWVNALLDQVAKNEESKALTQLWTNLAVEATDPAFPAHEYFLNRYRATRDAFAMQFALTNSRTEPSEEDRTKAAVLIAVWDGLQTQWLLDPEFEMKRPFEYALGLVARYPEPK